MYNNTTNFFEQLLNRSINEFVGNDFSLSIPAANIIEHTDKYQIMLAAPGLDKSDFNIKVENNYIVVSVDKVTETNPEGQIIKRKEFNYSKFKRNFIIPENIDTESIKAAYMNGILTITLFVKEKKEETAKNIVIE